MWSRFGFLLVLLLAGCNEHAKQVQVLDGHALQIGPKKILLHGVEAPEVGQRCGSGASEWRCGMAAREELIKLIANHKVECKSHGRDGHDNSPVAICTAGGVDLGEAMVRSGLAKADRHHPEVYAKAEAEARAANRGLWAQNQAAAQPGSRPSGATN